MRWAFASVVLVPRGAQGAFPDPSQRRHVLEWVAQTGFSGIEISPRWLDFHTLTSRELRVIKAEIAAAGLCVSGVNINRCILTRSKEAIHHLASLERGIAVAEELEARLLNLSLSMPTLPGLNRPPLRGRDIPDAEHQRSAELVAGLAELAGRCGVNLSVEMHDDGLLDTPEACLQLLQRVGAPNVGVNPDLGNICRGPGPLPDWEVALKLLAPKASCWHVKNYRGGCPAPVWEGDIDYNRAFAIMRSADYQGWVSIESYFAGVFDLQKQFDLQKSSLDYLKRLPAN